MGIRTGRLDLPGRFAGSGSLPNVLMRGEQPYDAITDFLGGWDVGIIPFKLLPLTLATNPVKVYEYLPRVGRSSRRRFRNCHGLQSANGCGWRRVPRNSRRPWRKR